MSNKANKVFEVTDKEVNRILFGDDSDDEEQLLLDEKDLEFLENDLDCVESNDNVDKIEVVIEPPAGNDMNTEKPRDLQKASFSVSTPAQEEFLLSGQKPFHNLQLLILEITVHLIPGQNWRVTKASKSNNFCQNFTF